MATDESSLTEDEMAALKRAFADAAREDFIDYDFGSPHYAAEFYELNQAHVLKSDFG